MAQLKKLLNKTTICFVFALHFIIIIFVTCNKAKKGNSLKNN